MQRGNLPAALAFGALLFTIGGRLLHVTDDGPAARTAMAQDAAVPPLRDQTTRNADRQITRAIRQALVANDRLSTKAQNVTVSTISSVVTLRGRVTRVDEKKTIVAMARKTTGVMDVADHLAVEDAD